MQRLAHSIFEMGAERVDRDGLADNVLDLFDRAAFEHVEDRLGLLGDAVGGIGGNKVVAGGDRIEDRSGGRTAEIDAATGEGDQ
ncbi:hypothetical protein D3C87_1935330 [compost metagenome]